ncbi:FAD-linked oxidoreductase-like protein, partial [Chytriomyces cf. hyalinus JEL632]
QVAKSLAIFKLCASPVFVRYGPVLLDAAEKVPGLKQAARFVVRKTFFEHFCGGENTQQVHATMTEYRERGIGVILNYAVEADVSTETPTLQATVEEARRVCAGMKESADIACEHPHNFIAMKVTPLIPPSVLLRWTNSLRAVYAAFEQDAREINEKNEALALATASDFQVIDAVFPFVEEIVAHSKSKHVKVIVDAEWTYVQPAIDDMALTLGKKFNGKRMAVNEGINGGRPVIFNTYQMYLKDALGRVHRELERAERGGYNVGIKIVRGAYIVSETERATSMGYENPICPTLEATHASFNSAISLCVQKIHDSTPTPSIETPLPVQFFSASHNFESVIHAWTLMKQYGIDFQSDCVGFGQLRGMQDGTTYGIAAHGLKGYKCVPYGPVEVTIPYLVRRAQENSAVLGGVKVDKENLWNEIKTRFGML